MMDALVRCKEQISAALSRCTLRSPALDREAQAALAQVQLAERNGRGHAQAIAATARVVMRLEACQREASRDARLVTAEQPSLFGRKA